MMQIQKIELHRFKKFKDKTININEGLTLVVGGNNSGKSSIMQALAAWQFCCDLVASEKGILGLLPARGKAGVGLSFADFTPLQVPSLSHLWTNLRSSKDDEQDGYTLKINVFWNSPVVGDKYLEMGMSLANDRLFIRSISTNLTEIELKESDPEISMYSHGYDPIRIIPKIAFLPPFAGITDREALMSQPARQKMVGQGLSGGVIRNMLLQIYRTYSIDERQAESMAYDPESEIVNPKQFIKDELKNSAWEILNKESIELFETQILVEPFNSSFHSYIKVNCSKGRFGANGKFVKYPKSNNRDIMAEGRGYLQWLSVTTMALSKDNDVLLLDEPDAHLNAALQRDLLRFLMNVSFKGKQILLATHSPELIRITDHKNILSVGSSIKYLAEDSLKIGVLAGIGAKHTKTFHSLIENNRILIVEGVSDYRFLNILGSRFGMSIPANIVPWYWTGKPSERIQLFRQLKMEISELKGLSLRDLDNDYYDSVNFKLQDKDYLGGKRVVDFEVLKWRRRHIENYLLSKTAIARAANVTLKEVDDFFATHGIVLSDDVNDVLPAIRDAYAKDIFNSGNNSIKKIFGITRDDVAKCMLPEEIPEDIYKLFNYLEVISS